MKLSQKILTLTGVGLMLFSVTACGNQNASNSSSNSEVTAANYHSGSEPYKNINDGKSTLNPKSWKYDHVHYSNLDSENRSSKGNTGWLDKKNIVGDSQRTRQNVKPTGWHQKFDNNNQPIINRGHEIAYSLSGGINKSGQYHPGQTTGDQDNIKNLFTQTAFSNQEVQTIFESKVRNALRNNEKVIYQVTPVFQGKDLMAKGVHMQAISTNKKLNFNVYLYNVQPGYKFNYANGRSSIDRNMKVKTPAGAPHFNNNRGNNGYNRRYSRHYYRRGHHYLKDYYGYKLARRIMNKHYRQYHHYPSEHIRQFHHYSHRL